jgi:hypothetical protein
VSVKGFVRSPQPMPMLVACEFTTTGPGTGVIMTAEELAREVAADSEKAGTRYKGKSFILTGEVSAVEARGTSLLVKLKGTADKPIECFFHSGDGTKLRDKLLVPGAKLKLYGEYRNYFTFENCELIAK